MRIFRRYIAPVLLAAVMLLAVRGLLVSHLRLPADADLPGLRPHAHVLVSLTHYGLRLPGERLWGYHRWGYRYPSPGDSVVFRLPPEAGKEDGQETDGFGICRALPGQTVWIDPAERQILKGRSAPGARPVVVPGRGNMVRVTPWNASLLAYLLNRYEGGHVRTDGRGGLLMGGQRVDKVQTMNDYYWVETHPGVYDLIPHRALVGKVIYVSGRDGGKPVPSR